MENFLIDMSRTHHAPSSHLPCTFIQPFPFLFVRLFCLIHRVSRPRASNLLVLRNSIQEHGQFYNQSNNPRPGCRILTIGQFRFPLFTFTICSQIFRITFKIKQEIRTITQKIIISAANWMRGTKPQRMARPHTHLV